MLEADHHCNQRVIEPCGKISGEPAASAGSRREKPLRSVVSVLYPLIHQSFCSLSIDALLPVLEKSFYGFKFVFYRRSDAAVRL